MQSNVVVEPTKISGSLKFIEGGLSPAGPLAGDGYFLALKFDSDDWTQYDEVTVALNPSASGMEPVSILEDVDKNGVFKIADNDQKLVIAYTIDDVTTTKEYAFNFTFEEV